MEPLDVEALDGSHHVSTREELAELLTTRVDGGNHFEIASSTSPYPMLDLLVAGPVAAVHYFAAEGEMPEQAAGNLADPPDEVEFPHSDHTTLIGTVLLDVATAMVCAEQFAETLRRPTNVEWVEL